MNMNYRQTQFELFPSTHRIAAEMGQPRYLFSQLTLSLENIIVILIFSVMICVFAFSLGVERGRNIVAVDKRIMTMPSVEKGTATSSQPAKTEIVPNLQSNQVITEVVDQVESESTAKALPDPASLPGFIEEKMYTIQVASYKSEKIAKREAEVLEKKGYEIYVLPKGSYSILCIGKFSEMQDAKKFSSKLRKLYKDLLVRRM
jgi:hypothetical protein